MSQKNQKLNPNDLYDKDFVDDVKEVLKMTGGKVERMNFKDDKAYLGDKE